MDLNCTANDVEVASVDVLNNVTTCVSGDQVSLHLRANLHANAQLRYNVGIFMAQDGKSTLLTSANGGSGVCSTFGLPTSPLPFTNADGNVCGDFDTTGLPQGQTTPLDLGTVTVTCTPDAEGYLDIPTIITWNTNANTLGCQAPPADWFVPENKSKCEAGISQRIPVQVLGRIDVVKQTLPDGAAGTFSFTASGSGASPTSFQLSDGGTQTVATGPLGATAQPYVITESQLAGWSSSAQIDCRDIDGDIAPFVVVNEANRTLTANMSANFNQVTCTFTNTQQASITINKATVGGNGTFDFTGSPTLGAFPITTAGGAGQASFNNLAPGTYTVSESIPAGWDLTALSCTDPTSDSVVNLASGTATIALAAGEHVDCTYTDTLRGQITVVKNTIGGNGTFNFTGPAGAFQLATSGNTAQTVIPNLIPNSYNVTESVPSGWDLTGLTCADPSSNSSTNLGTATATANVGPGENVVCTFTDTQRGKIVVNKQVSGADATFNFTGAAAFAITTAGGFGQDQTTFASVVPGQYTFGESPLAHYALTAVACDDPTGNSTTNLGAGTVTAAVGPGETVTCTFTNTQLATLTVIKDAVPHDPQVFAFGTVGNGLTNFQLFDDGSNTGNSATFADLMPGGNYAVVESAVAAWPLTSITCTDQADPNPANRTTVSVPGGSITPNLQPGETLRCVFTNVRNDNGAIAVIKRTIGALAANTGGTFDFTNSGGVVDSGTNPASFQLTTTVANPEVSRSLTTLAAGTYTITELAPPAGWDFTNLQCVVTNGSNTTFQYAAAAVTISLGTTGGNVDGVACTYTNTHRSGITIVKQSTPQDPQDFAFTTTGGLTPATFSLDDDADATLSNTQPFPDIAPETYTITEQAVAGWKLTAIACTGAANVTTDLAAGKVTIDLKSGETPTCTFQNAKNGTITIHKVANGGAPNDQFTFTGPQTLAGSIGNGGQLSGSFVAGTYSVTEVVPAGWDLTNIVCTGGTVTITGASASPTNGFEAGDTTVNITIASGDTVSCTFTDTKRAGITIVKNTLGGDGAFAFAGAQSFQIQTSGGSGQNTTAFASVPPGTYPVTETVPAGWRLTALTCTNASVTSIPNATATVQLAAGENVTCTFTNTRQGTVRIVKRIESDETAAFTFTAPAALAPTGSFVLTPDVASAEAVQEFANVVPGTYAVSETVPAGWKLLSINCVDPTSNSAVNVATATASINVAAGETVECTFDDTQLSAITISVVSTGGTGTFPFSTSNLGANNFALSTPADGVKASRSFIDLPPGTYTSDGLGLAGWKFDGVICHAQSNETYWTITGAHVTLTLPHGEVIECTYYYSLIPPPPPPTQLPILAPWLYGLIGVLLVLIAGGQLRTRQRR